MTAQCVVRAALTEERSKAEIKNSALRCRDESDSREGRTLIASFCFFCDVEPTGSGVGADGNRTNPDIIDIYLIVC